MSSSLDKTTASMRQTKNCSIEHMATGNSLTGLLWVVAGTISDRLLFERCAIRLWLILAVVVAVDFLLIENAAATGMLRQPISRNLLENLAWLQLEECVEQLSLLLVGLVP